MQTSMHAGISCMKSNQSKMDVIGNNIANVGTTSFKKSTASFSDSFSQIVSEKEEVKANKAISGIGSRISAISKNMVQGSMQTTGRNTDLAIDGEGFFMVDLGNGTKGYTRDGSFSLDTDGQLVTAQGYRVMCIAENHTIQIDLENYSSFSVSKDGSVMGIYPDGTKEEIDTINRVTFENPAGLEAIGNNIYIESENSGEYISNSPYAGAVNQGYIEMSNVDLSEEFSEMIVTTRAFQAASKIITTSDELLQEIASLIR